MISKAVAVCTFFFASSLSYAATPVTADAPMQTPASIVLNAPKAWVYEETGKAVISLRLKMILTWQWLMLASRLLARKYWSNSRGVVNFRRLLGDARKKVPPAS